MDNFIEGVTVKETNILRHWKVTLCNNNKQCLEILKNTQKFERMPIKLKTGMRLVDDVSSVNLLLPFNFLRVPTQEWLPGAFRFFWVYPIGVSSRKTNG